MAKRKEKKNFKVASSSDGSKRATIGDGGGGGLHQQPKVHPALDDCYPLNKLCRLCLLSNTNMEPIFTFTGDIELSQRIFQCTGLEIHENEEKGIPTSICGQCKRQLDQCHEFRTLCWKNNDVLHNLNLILSPRKVRPAATPTLMSAVPIVQVEKLKINPSLLPKQSKPASSSKQRSSSKSYGEVALSQLYSPSKRGHKAAKLSNRFTRELVICLTPMPQTLLNKYKKKVAKTQTKAAMKSFSPTQPAKSPKQLATPGRKSVKPLKIKIAKPKTSKPEKTPQAAAKKTKAKPVEIAVPPKKRKQHFEPVPEAKVLAISCSLCMQSFSNMKNLARHTAAHENNRKQSRVFNCDVCQKEYLKASQLTDHLRSAEHVNNAANNAPDEADVSILPDEQSILPDTNGQQDNISTTVASPTDEVGRQVASSDAEEEEQAMPQPRPARRQLSPISVDSDSLTPDGVQYSDVCSTNNEESLLNGSAARRVSFAEVTEILD
ncbi:muscle M-line assembly protein unc-89-like isoform X2 [Culex pipiens pallens]|uniref:muscle M-line assembly protein unc-89-like isoform X2 n=1 Tax=Culex pipiens pallens TaxID=42434 RepID=UPI001953B528|nr:muscle M-line assembly protein unc-89-like isoform X2 [Culex pipiens pallens]